MSTFGNYTNGSGTTESRNPQARQIIVEAMIEQGLREVQSLSLPPLAFRLFEQKNAPRSPLKGEYCIAWRGR